MLKLRHCGRSVACVSSFCVSGMPDEEPNSFSYTKVFYQQGTVFYTSGSQAAAFGVTQAGMSGVVQVYSRDAYLFGYREY